MKSKRIIPLALIGIMSFGSVKAFAQVTDNTIQNNTVMTEKADTQNDKKVSREDKLKETALNAFQKYFNETVDVKNLYERSNRFYEVQGQKLYVAEWCNQNNEYINGNKAVLYTAIIDVETNKIVSLSYHPGQPKDENYKNFSYDEAKNLAADFLKSGNILDSKSYEFLEEESDNVNEARDAELDWEYHFYFKDNQGKKYLVNVNKDLKKVNSYLIIDESGIRG